MTVNNVLHTSLALAFGAVTLTCAAQTADRGLEQGSAASPSPSIVQPPADRSAAFRSERPELSPSNVLEDVPRNMGGTPVPVACDGDPAISDVPVKCRRWLEIARTL